MFVQAAEEATIGPSFEGVMCQMLQGFGQPLLPRAREEEMSAEIGFWTWPNKGGRNRH